MRFVFVVLFVLSGEAPGWWLSRLPFARSGPGGKQTATRGPRETTELRLPANSRLPRCQRHPIESRRGCCPPWPGPPDQPIGWSRRRRDPKRHTGPGCSRGRRRSFRRSSEGPRRTFHRRRRSCNQEARQGRQLSHRGDRPGRPGRCTQHRLSSGAAGFRTGGDRQSPLAGGFAATALRGPYAAGTHGRGAPAVGRRKVEITTPEAEPLHHLGGKGQGAGERGTYSERAAKGEWIVAACGAPANVHKS